MKKILMLVSLLSVLGLGAEGSQAEESTLQELERQVQEAWAEHVSSPAYNEVFDHRDRARVRLGHLSQLEKCVGQLYEHCLHAKTFASFDQQPCDRYYEASRLLEFHRENSLRKASKKYDQAMQSDQYKRYEEKSAELQSARLA